MNAIDIPPAAFMVTDNTGHQSLHLELARAEQQFSQRPGCRLDHLLTRSAVLAALWGPEPAAPRCADIGGET